MLRYPTLTDGGSGERDVTNSSAGSFSYAVLWVELFVALLGVVGAGQIGDVLFRVDV